MATADPNDISRMVVRNSVVVSVGNWLSKLLFLGFNIVVVRMLGEVGLGHYATVIAFVGVFGILFNLGMSQHMERTIVRDPTMVATLFWNLVGLRLVLALVGVWMVSGLAIGAGFDRHLVVGVVIYACTYVLGAVQVPLTGVLRAHDRFDAVTLALLVSRAVTAGVSIVLLWLGVDFLALLIAAFIALPIQIWLSVIAVRSTGIDLTLTSISPRNWTSMVRAGVPFGLLVMGLSFNANTITVVLAAFTDAATVGWYTASYRLVFHAIGIMGGFLIAMMPALTRLYAREPDRAVRWASVTFDWLVLCALPVSAGLSIVAPRVIHVLYGSSFAPASSVLRLLAWDIALMLAVAYLANVCVAGGMERIAALTYLGAMVANAALAILLILAFDAMGAAIVNLAVDACTGFVLIAALSRNDLIRFSLPRIGKTFIATVVMGAIVFISLSLPLGIVILIGIVAYSVLVSVFGLADWRDMFESVRRRRTSEPETVA